MTTVAIPDKYVETLRALGDVDTAVNLAVQRYTIEQITAKITKLRQQSARYESKYGMDFFRFQEAIQGEAFIEELEAAGYKTWEIDQADWAFCHEGIQDWTDTLQTILLS